MSGKHRRAAEEVDAAPASVSASVDAGPLLLATAVLPPPPPPRVAAREARQQRASRRTKLIAGAAVVVVLAAAVAFLVGPGSGGKGDTRAGAPARTQSTLLLQLLGAKNVAQSSVLLAHDTASGGSGAGVLVPSALVVNVPGFGSSSFGDASALGTTSGAALALSDALGVLVDGSWTLQPAAFAALVDAVGGVQVNAQAQVTRPTANGGATVLIPPGPQKLDGALAVVYASYLGSGEPEQGRLARFSEVWQQVVTQLPSQPDQLSALVAKLGPGSKASLSGQKLATFLLGLKSDERDQQMTYQNLPVRSLDTGAAEPASVLDQAQAEQLVTSQLSGSRPPVRASGPVRVLVQNGVGTPGLGETTRKRLIAAGLTYVNGGNAAQFGYAKSVVLIPDASEQSRREGTDVASALRLPQSSLRIAAQGQTIADVVVIVGADFKP
jgi:hypothetical protein